MSSEESPQPHIVVALLNNGAGLTDTNHVINLISQDFIGSVAAIRQMMDSEGLTCYDIMDRIYGLRADQTLHLVSTTTVPADYSAVASLKRVRVKELADLADEECSICLKELRKEDGNEEEDKEYVCYMPCHHVFHEDCLVKWLNINHLCPLCRFELPAADQDL